MSDRVVIDGDTIITSTIDGEGNAVIRLGQNPVIEPLEVAENGTYTVPEGIDGFNPVTVHLPKAMTAEQIATGEDAWGDLTIEAEYVIPSAFRVGEDTVFFRNYHGDYNYFGTCKIKKLIAENCLYIGADAFFNRDIEEAYLPKCVYLGSGSLRTNALTYDGVRHTPSLHYLYAPLLEYIGCHAFGYSNYNFGTVIYPKSLKYLDLEFGAPMAETAIFLGTPSTIGTRALMKGYWGKLTDIYVPWSEGEVAGAPWGATSATIHYDTPLDDFAASWDGNLLQQEVVHL